jgi:proteic killer suppression protein
MYALGSERMAIRDYADRRTAAFVQGERVREFEQCKRPAIRAIAKLQAVTRLIELRNPPSNHFEAVKGEPGLYSIRIDGKWRVCFRWAFTETAPESTDALMVQGEPYDVEINNHYAR